LIIDKVIYQVPGKQNMFLKILAKNAGLRNWNPATSKTICLTSSPKERKLSRTKPTTVQTL